MHLIIGFQRGWLEKTCGLIPKTYHSTLQLLVHSLDYSHQYVFLHSYTFDDTYKDWLINVPLVHQLFLQVHQQVVQAVPFSVVFLQGLPGMETHHHHHRL